jgi:hypothetical protein
MPTKPLTCLASAASRADGAVLPPADGHSAAPGFTSLLKRHLVTEIEVADAALSWRHARGRAIGFVITDLGRQAAMEIESAIEVKIAPGSKIGRVIDALMTPQGATLEQLQQCTGWQPHSLRAALTTLRKKGLAVQRHARSGRSVYRLKDA